MGQHILSGNPPVAVTLRRSGRARRISLRVSGLDGRVTLTLPTGVPESEGLSFAQEKADWLRAQIQTRAPIQQVALGSALPFRGADLQLVPGAGRSVTLAGSELRVPGDPAQAGRRVLGFVKQAARDHLVEASDFYARRLGLPFSRITLRDTRSRWGSCSSQGALMYSWRLVMAPPSVLNYVAAHEVAHLAHMNHSARFWAEVAGLYGDYDRARVWLRDHGASLHRYRFGD